MEVEGQMAKKPKFYAVRKGAVPGIYRTWAECEANVKGFLPMPTSCRWDI